MDPGWLIDADAEIVVVSDLHIGRGENPDTGRFYALEAFFYDDDFARFCDFLCADAERREVRLTLVLNGDVFDLLRVEPEPPAGDDVLAAPRFGAPNTPETAPGLVRQVLAGHPAFVDAIAEVLSRGHHVVLLAGNHDVELQWPPVRAEVQAAVAAALRERGSAEERERALERLIFRSWFYYVPGRIWIEHGCQYDPANAFRYFLRGNLTDVEEAVYAAEHDMPLGNFFQRYLYNAFGHLTFIVPDARANARYVRWFLLNEPRLLARVLLSHLPFAAKVLRRIAKSTDPARSQLASAHQQALARIAESTGLGEQLHAVDRLKDVEADSVQAAKSITRQALKTVSLFLVASLAAVAVWFVGFMAINELRAGMGLRALLFITLSFGLLATGAGVATWRLLRGPKSWKGQELQAAAVEIAALVDVPIVTFGHTHVETIARTVRRDGAPAWYFNTGTWIAVFTNDVLVPRERVQYTYLHVRGDQGRLLHWSPGRGEPLKVILLDD